MALSTAAVPLMDAALTHEKRSSTADQVAALNNNSELRIVSPSEYKHAALCLAEAFRDDHCVRYAIDTPDRMHLSEADRFAMHRQSLEYVTYAHCLKGIVTTIGDNYDCVALWMPPGQNMDDWWTILRSGMWRLKFMLSAEGNERFFKEFLPLLHTTKDEVLGDRDQTSWYLNYIGTKPGSRGKGYAKKLIQHITKRADEAGQACYLESSHDINVVIYGKMGFKLMKQIYLRRAEHDVRLDVMVRDPVAQHAEKSLGQ